MAADTCESIWIVDDDEAVRDSVKAVLATVEWPVETFSSARQFLDSFDPARAGCVVTDVCMSGMDGLELQTALAERCPGVPVIVMTGHADVAMAVKAMKAGATDFIEKPFGAEVLIDRIRQAIEMKAKTCQMDPGAADEIRARVERLTPREREVLHHLVVGQPNKVIAHELGISPRTVEIHRSRVMRKMEAESISALVRMIMAAGLDTP